jgi:S-adenosylmethionine-diacylglycerol 3-amino-3-carboxypropyl transferase
MIHTRTTRQKLNTRIFKAVHGRNLIYNTCWEDPALDRVALKLGPDDKLVVITSAGCNALDYLLAGAGEVHAVDVNPIQNALLELKRAAILGLDHDAFFELFGRGRSPHARQMYQDALRRRLSPRAQVYWDKHISFFLGKGWRKSFYYRGTSGLLAKLVLMNVHVLHRLRKPIQALLDAGTVEEQRTIYESNIRPRIWTPWLRWFLSRSLTLSLLGVPWPQRDQITSQYQGGVAQFIRDQMETVVTQLPFGDNYFWRVYIQGYYTPDCCPEYLKAGNFRALRAAMSRLHVHTSTITEFVKGRTGLTRFVLLDHMDWMSCNNPQGLVEEWNAILASAGPGARAIFRSAGLRVNYLDHLLVSRQGRQVELGSLLRYHPELAAELHQRDRVHTYGSFYIADLPGGGAAAG